MGISLTDLALAAAYCVALALAYALDLRHHGSSTFYVAYLLAFLFWTGLSLGALGLHCLAGLTGGRWGAAILHQTRKMSLSLPILFLISIPVLLAPPALYPWANSAANEGVMPLPEFTRRFLEPPFFLVRGTVYFLLWIGLSRVIARSLGPVTRVGQRGEDERFPAQASSAVGMIVLFLSTTFASIDWIMSLDVPWHSSAFGAVAAVSFAGAALSAAILGVRKSVAPPALNDLGKMLLTLSILWLYLAYGQYLIVWTGNISEDSRYYTLRGHNPWRLLSGLILLTKAGVPVVLLLFARKQLWAVSLACLSTLAGYPLELAWDVAPPVRLTGAGSFIIGSLIAAGLFGACWFYWQRKDGYA